jgi:hypothetical protein
LVPINTWNTEFSANSISQKQCYDGQSVNTNTAKCNVFDDVSNGSLTRETTLSWPKSKENGKFSLMHVLTNGLINNMDT